MIVIVGLCFFAIATFVAICMCAVSSRSDELAMQLFEEYVKKHKYIKSNKKYYYSAKKRRIYEKD